MKKQKTEFVYGDRKGSWFSLTGYKTQKEAEEAGIISMINQVLNGYTVLEDYGIFKKEWTSESDEFGLLNDKSSTELVLGICKEYVNNYNWSKLMIDKITNMTICETTIFETKDQIDNLKFGGQITDQEAENLQSLLWEKSQIRKIIGGDFTEGSTVTVNINGFVVSRKVRWSGSAKDLYIVYDNRKYFYGEFTDERNL